MATNFYYVYALKDPLESQARPFYIGKPESTEGHRWTA